MTLQEVPARANRNALDVSRDPKNYEPAVVQRSVKLHHHWWAAAAITQESIDIYTTYKHTWHKPKREQTPIKAKVQFKKITRSVLWEV